MNPAPGLPKNRSCRLLLLGLALLLVLPACTPETGQGNEKLSKEIKELKGEIKSLKEQVARLEAGQQAMLDLLKRSAPPAPVTAWPMQPQQPMVAQPLMNQPPPAQPPAPGKILTVSELLTHKEQYLGTRVTVKGPAGPVLVHHKSMFLRSPRGMVEVFFGKIADQKVVQYLTSATLEQPVTVTGMVTPPGKTGSAALQIEADSIDF